MAPSPSGSAEGSRLLEEGNGSLNKPLYSGNATEDAAPASQKKPNKQHSLMLFCFLGVLGYLCLGVLVYTCSGMRPLDALYFCVVTLTTVGYGDMSAHKPITKLFACFYILAGVALIGALLSKLIELLLDQQEALLVDMMEKRRQAPDQAPVEVNADQVGVAMGIFWFFMVVVLGTTVFKLSGDLTLIDALYLTVVSASTVGYGDFYPTTTATRVFAVFFLPVSTLLLAKIISDYTEMRVQAGAQERQDRIIQAALTKTDLLAMDDGGDGDGKVSPYEFLCSTLVALDKVTPADIEAVRKRFCELDRDGSGYVEMHEVG